MKHKTYFAVFVVASMMTGCKIQKKSDAAAAKQTQAKTAQQPQVQPKPEINRELRLGDIFAEFVGQRRPNVYNLLLSWPETRDSLRLSIDGKVIFTDKTSVVQNYTFPNLDGNTKLTLFIEILDGQGRVLSSENRDLEVPLDYVIPEQLILTYNMKFPYNRVFMIGSVITTQDYILEIKTKELIILNDSLIQNYAPDTKAAVGYNGRNGGSVFIEAESAYGILKVNLNAEAGGDGLQGYYETRLVGKEKNEIRLQKCVDGGGGYNAGRNGDFYLKVENAANFYPVAENLPVAGGNPGPKLGHVSPAYPSLPEGSACPQNPGVGSSNQPGKICVNIPGRELEKGCQ